MKGRKEEGEKGDLCLMPVPSGGPRPQQQLQLKEIGIWQIGTERLLCARSREDHVPGLRSILADLTVLLEEQRDQTQL